MSGDFGLSIANSYTEILSSALSAVLSLQQCNVKTVAVYYFPC